MTSDTTPAYADARPPRVLVCGSREWDDEAAVSVVLHGVAHRAVRRGARPSDVVLVHGAARGADTCAETVGRELGFEVVGFPADWEGWAARGNRNGAGPDRNRRMLEEGRPTVVFAFTDAPLGARSGTWHMVGLSRAAGVPTYVLSGSGVPAQTSDPLRSRCR